MYRDKILDNAVKKSLNIVKDDRYSILPCADNYMLDPDYNPLEDLKQRITLKCLLEKYGINPNDVEF